MTDNIKKLTEYQHTRLRTEMYFGSRVPHTQLIVVYDEQYKPQYKEMTWVPALYTTFREILDNALDEVVGHGYGDRIDIEYDSSNFLFSITDNGRGIPIDWDDEEKCHKATLALAHARAGRNFDDRGSVAGVNGLGGAGCNFCSEWFNIEIHRDGQKFKQEFSEDGADCTELIINQPQITKITSSKTGTKIEFKLSNKVFPEMILPEEFVRSRLVDISISNPSLKLYFNGNRVKAPDMKHILGDKHFSFDIVDGDYINKFYIKYDFDMADEVIHSTVNNIPAFNGGSNIDGFRKSFYKTLISELSKESKKRKLTPNNSDIQKDFLILSYTQMKSPDFDSQSKTRLINEEPEKIVRKYFEDGEVYKKIIKKYPDWIGMIYERCAERTHKKDLDEINKLSKKLAKAKVPKLRDASSRIRENCILFIMEGDSAAAGMTEVRNPDIHASLPLRGKVMNVSGMAPKDVLANKELADIMNSIGLVIGQKADRKNLRYGKIYIAHDADEDGKNIGALLINFFYSFWPELFSGDPYIFVFETPFIIGTKGKERKYWYSSNYESFNADEYKGFHFTRAKGLGTLEKEDWKISINNPELIPIIDDGNLGETLDKIFNPTRADDRKDWMGNA